MSEKIIRAVAAQHQISGLDEVAEPRHPLIARPASTY
jgi:hypothetical protein